MTDLVLPPATTHLNYPGDITTQVNARLGVPMGPNTLGELLYPVSADYDPEKGRTRVGFSYTAPNRVSDRC